MSENVHIHPRVRHGADCPVVNCCACAFGSLGEAATKAGDAFQALIFALPAKVTGRAHGRRARVASTHRRRFQGIRERVKRFPVAGS